MVVVCGLCMTYFALLSLNGCVSLQKVPVWFFWPQYCSRPDHLRRVSSIFPLFSLNESDTVIRWKSTLTLKVTSSICKEVPLCSFSDIQYIHLANTVIYYTHRKIHSMEKNTSPLQPPTPSSSSFPGKSWSGSDWVWEWPEWIAVVHCCVFFLC